MARQNQLGSPTYIEKEVIQVHHLAMRVTDAEAEWLFRTKLPNPSPWLRSPCLTM